MPFNEGLDSERMMYVSVEATALAYSSNIAQKNSSM